ncbi:ribosome assembly factor SBDS [Candidatus Pacearchaeota archaeon]|nr:ribosome assembly factor SBDS [Candidatus Pacearchaeota archaeon]
MTQTIARIKQKGKHFEIMVDLDLALKYRKGMSNNVDFLEIDRIFTDHKKGLHASSKDLMDAFGTDNVYEIAGKIVKSGEVLVTQEHRSEERDKKIKQVVDFLVVNAIDPKSGRKITPERMKTALEEANVNIKNAPAESQISEIMEQLSKVLPIKMETKRIKITVPAIHTGKAYGLVNQYKEKEDWLANGDLEIVVNIPAGLAMDFFDKLNSSTHGSVLTQEIKQ